MGVAEEVAEEVAEVAEADGHGFQVDHPHRVHLQNQELPVAQLNIMNHHLQGKAGPHPPQEATQF